MNRFLDRVIGKTQTETTEKTEITDSMEDSGGVNDTNKGIDVVFDNLPISEGEHFLIQELAELQREQNKILLRRKIRLLKKELNRTKLEHKAEKDEEGEESEGKGKKEEKEIIQNVEEAITGSNPCYRVRGTPTGGMEASCEVNASNNGISVSFDYLPIYGEEQALIQEVADLQREQNMILLHRKIRLLKKELKRTKLEDKMEGEAMGEKEILEDMEKSPALSPHSSGYSSARSTTTNDVKRRDYDLAAFLSSENSKSATFEELIEGALNWGIHQEDLSNQQLKDYMGHVAVLAHHAKGRHFTDTAYVEYDADVRKLAGYIGMVAFRGKKDEYADIHFGRQDSTGREMMKNISTWACLSHNYVKEGCRIRHCKYLHNCVYCGKATHKGPDCRSKQAHKD